MYMFYSGSAGTQSKGNKMNYTTYIIYGLILVPYMNTATLHLVYRIYTVLFDFVIICHITATNFIKFIRIL